MHYGRDALYKMYMSNTVIGKSYKALLNKKTGIAEQIDTPFTRGLYEKIYKQLHGRVLHLGLGMNLGEDIIKCDEMIFVEKSVDVIMNVSTKWNVIQMDAVDLMGEGIITRRLGRFDTIFIDVTSSNRLLNLEKYKSPQGKILWLR